MILSNKFSYLAIALPLLVTTSIFAMEPERPKKPAKRNYMLDSSVIAEGNWGKVSEGSPMKNPSPTKRKIVHDDKIPAVHKKLKRDGDISTEAKRQTEIREAIRKQQESLVRHIPVVDYFGKTSFKMEKAPGKRLEDIYRHLTPTEFLGLMKNVMIFISVMHDAGYSHEDLSLSNIMADPAHLGDFTIIDFGLAGKIGEDTRTMTGALGFSAPEVKNGNYVGKEADVYSLGKIILKYFGIFLGHSEIDILIEMMTDENIKKRISLSDAIQQITYILEKPDINVNTMQVCEACTIGGYDTALDL